MFLNILDVINYIVMIHILLNKKIFALSKIDNISNFDDLLDELF